MNKAPFIVIGIFLIATAFVILFAHNESNPLAVLDGKATATPTMIQLNSIKTDQQTPMPTIQQQDIISATAATIQTPKGAIEIELYPQDAPKTVQNFATLASKGYYNGLTFHRVEDWVIQTGDPTRTGAGGDSIFGDTFEDELNPETPSYKAGYQEGVVAMANRGPNTNSSQFFILKRATPLDPAYTIFGKVTSGMQTVQQLQKGDELTSITVK